MKGTETVTEIETVTETEMVSGTVKVTETVFRENFEGSYSNGLTVEKIIALGRKEASPMEANEPFYDASAESCSAERRG